MVEYRSVSQVKELNDCGYQYQLKRLERDENGDRLWQRPAAWFPQGLAVHEAVEQVEKSDRTLSVEEAIQVFSDSYEAHTNRLCEQTPVFSDWFRSGPYRGRDDVERRYGKGKEQVEKYFADMAKNPDDVPDVIDGEKLVEYPFTVKFGTVEVRGIVDQFRNQKPVDVKTGNKAGDPLQLKVYAAVAQLLWGFKPSIGFFWMGKTGKMTKPVDVSDATYDHIAEVFGEADEKIRNGEFEPNPDPDRCRFCVVSHACEFKVLD